ncbi:MAG TPA: hypothetical protein VFZ34_14600 [Blastocatellia bacterium]|nr:hypothetical protein [Blastocatellia bacterium]
MNKKNSAQSKSKQGLEIESDPVYQRRIWRLERISWVVIVLLLLAALLGMFGDGVFSRGQISDANGTLHVEYERLARFSASIQLHLRAQTTQPGETRLWVSQAYLDHMSVDAISPPPERVEMTTERQIYLYRSTQAGAMLDVIFHLRPQRMGRLRGAAGTDTGAQVSFQSFIYP